MSPPADALGRNLRIHCLVLAAVVLTYAVLAWSVFSTPEVGFDPTRLVVILSSLYVAGYAFVTSVVLVLVGRRRGAAIILHALALTLGLGALAIGGAIELDAARDPPRRLDEDDVEARTSQCLRVGPIRADVDDEARPRAELTMTSACPTAVTIGDITVIGFVPGGGNHILGADDWLERTLAPGRSLRVALRGAFPVEPGSPADTWAWRVDVDVDVDVGVPKSLMLCFASPGAPDPRGCAALNER